MAGEIHFNKATPEGFMKARYFYTQAAKGEHGLPEAAYLLGSLFIDAKGVQHNRKRGTYWLKRAVKGGNADACHRMAALSIDNNKPNDPFNKKALRYLQCSDPQLLNTQAFYCKLYWCTPKAAYHCEQTEKLTTSTEQYQQMMKNDWRICARRFANTTWEEWLAHHSQ